MPSAYQRTSARGSWTNVALQEAMKLVRDQGWKIATAARRYSLPRSTLRRHSKGSVLQPGLQCLGRKTQRVFDDGCEQELADYLLLMNDRGFGLTRRDVMDMAYEYADANDIKHPWKEADLSASRYWLDGFMRRHKQLSLRKTEGLSIARAMFMNKPMVSRYQLST